MERSFALRTLYTGCVLVGCLALTGCPKRPEVALAAPSGIGPGAGTAPNSSTVKAAPKIAEVPVARPATPAEAPVKPAPTVATVSPLKDIFFEFDDSTVRADQKQSVEQDFAYLKAHPDAKVLVEGNCDERGTEEYNLALGERRAETVKNALVAEGITADRINTVSYGKDKPFALGHDENAWRLNRRDHFALAQ